MKKMTRKCIASFTLTTHCRLPHQQLFGQDSQYCIIHGNLKLDMLQIRHVLQPQEPRGISTVLLDEQLMKRADACNLLQVLVANDAYKVQPTMAGQSVEAPDVARIPDVLDHHMQHASHLPDILHRRFLIPGCYIDLQDTAICGEPRIRDFLAKSHIADLLLCHELQVVNPSQPYEALQTIKFYTLIAKLNRQGYQQWHFNQCQKVVVLETGYTQGLEIREPRNASEDATHLLLLAASNDQHGQVGELRDELQFPFCGRRICNRHVDETEGLE